MLSTSDQWIIVDQRSTGFKYPRPPGWQQTSFRLPCFGSTCHGYYHIIWESMNRPSPARYGSSGAHPQIMGARCDGSSSRCFPLEMMLARHRLARMLRLEIEHLLAELQLRLLKLCWQDGVGREFAGY